MNTRVVEGQYDSRLMSEGVQAFHASRAKRRLLEGGFSSQKTTAAIWEAIDLSMQAAQPTVGLIGRYTYPELIDTTMARFYEVCPDDLIVSRREAIPPSCTLVGGHRVLFRHLQEEKQYRGLKLGWAFIDQAEEIPEETVKTVIARLLHPAGPRRLILACNPDEPEHWLYRWFHHGEMPDSAWFATSPLENRFLPPDYVASLLEADELWQRRYVKGEWTYLNLKEAVFPEWTAIHEQRVEPDKTQAQVMGWDFGFTHPALVLWQAVENQVQVWGERLGDKETTSAFIQSIKRLFPEPFTWSLSHGADPSGTQSTVTGSKTAMELLEEAGIHPRYKKRPISDGITLIHELLLPDETGRPRLIVDPDRCPIFTRAMRGGYRRQKNPVTDGAFLDKPLKDGYYDHLVDAFRYAVTTHVEIRSKPTRPMPKTLRRFFRRNPYTTHGGWAALR